MKKLIFFFLIVVTACAPQAKNDSSKPTQASEILSTGVYEVVIAELGGEKIEGTVYVPEGERTLPGIVLFAGGDGSHKNRLEDEAMKLSEEGYVVFLSNYQLLPSQSAYPGFIHNTKSVIRFFRANAGMYAVDADKIFVMGTSFGGVAASLVGTTGDVPSLEGDIGVTGVSSSVAGVIDFFGSVYFGDIGEGTPEEAKELKAFGILFGCSDVNNCDMAESLKPAQYISSADPPFLIIHGADDNSSPHEQSELLADALESAGVPVTLLIKDGWGHDAGLLLDSLEEIHAFVEEQ